MIPRTLAVLLISTLCIGLAAPSFANYYKRGGAECKDFEGVKRDHQKYPESFSLEYNYALCLLVRGDDDVQALNILENLALRHNDVLAAFVLADYTATGGTFGSNLDPNNFDEALPAYGRVLLLIDYHS